MSIIVISVVLRAVLSRSDVSLYKRHEDYDRVSVEPDKQFQSGK